MALDAALVVNAGSGALWLALGAFILVVGRRRPENVALGVLTLAFGGQFLAFNYGRFASEHALGATVASAAFYALGSVAALAAIWRFARPRPLGRVMLTAAVVAGVAAALLPRADAVSIAGLRALGFPEDAVHVFLTYLAPGLAFELAALAAFITTLALSQRAPDDAGTARPARRLLALAFGLYLGYSFALNLVTTGSVRDIFLVACAVAAGASWLATGVGTRSDRSTALLLVAAPLAGAVGGAWLGEDGPGPVGVGVLRTAGAALIAYAIVRHDLLRVPLPRLVLHRGAAAAGALATLFIVAQVAQEFLSAEFGLLTGGVVAGALLFAAHPIQRAMERLLANSTPVTAAGARPDAPLDERAAAAYRAAVRLAIRDGTIPRREEIHLSEIAHHLGLGPREAAALKHEVEDGSSQERG